MNPDIMSAIRQRKRLIVNYEPGQRIIEPHAYGLGSHGQELLRAFQISGASASGEHVDWKLFRVDRINGLMPANENFAGPRPGYRRGDKAMSRIYVQL